MSELLKLAERCEAATGPDRELDALIACHAPICRADYILSARPSQKRGMVTRYFDDGGHGTFVCENYTASLDAAMTLVPEGCASAIGTMAFVNETRLPWACIWTPQGEPTWRSDAATPALALCAAALRALTQGQSR